MDAGHSANQSGERRKLASPRAILAAEEILAHWDAERDSAPLDRLVQWELRARRHLNSAERRWVGDAVFGAVRFWRRDSLILERSGAGTSVRERIELWAREEVDADPGRLESAGLLPGPERPDEYLRETLSFPDAMADALNAALGNDAIPAARAFNGQAPTTLRVNTLRSTRQHVLDRLPNARRTQFSPWGIELSERINLHELPDFRAGLFEVQEEASQLVALLTDACPGQTVVDIGAGAGGKSIALAAMMRNKGRIKAIDTSPDRLSRIGKRAVRAGARIIDPLSLTADANGRWQLSATEQRSVDILRERADCVLVDAPCSGSGVLRRAPDIRWRSIDTSEFALLQVQLLEQSAQFVAPGGCLIYATCAFESVQDEDVIERFLGSIAGTAFELVSALDRLRGAMVKARQPGEAVANEFVESLEGLDMLMSGPFLRTWPHRGNLDAFFAACLRRKP